MTRIAAKPLEAAVGRLEAEQAGVSFVEDLGALFHERRIHALERMEASPEAIIDAPHRGMICVLDRGTSRPFGPQ